MCLRTGRGGKDVGISNQRGARCTSPLSRARGVRVRDERQRRHAFFFWHTRHELDRVRGHQSSVAGSLLSRGVAKRKGLDIWVS